VLDHAQLAGLGGKLFGSVRAAQDALDATVPRGAMLAHMGAARFDATCLAPQVHFYVADSLLVGTQRLGEQAQRVIERDFRPVRRIEADSLGWHLVRLSWTDDKTDFIHPGALEVWTRRTGNRYLVLGIFDRFAGAAEVLELLMSLQVPKAPE
jgi:hypothetical protein